MVNINSAIAIIGNGFDLHLGLKSRIKDFLETRIFEFDGDKYNYSGINLLFLLLYYRFFASGEYDYYIFRRVENSNPSWVDVEGFLKKIATEEKTREFLYDIYGSYASIYYPVKYVDSSLSNAIFELFTIRKPSLSGSNSVVDKILLDDLIEFETLFKKYMNSQVTNYKVYKSESDKFIRKIIQQVLGCDNKIQPIIYLYNFNYTTINSLITVSSNVHGSLGKQIVIGYDSTESSSKDEIFELSKDWQKINVESDIDLRHIQAKDIIFYGHSLGEQDYPYFFEIFDSTGLLSEKSNTIVYFCYSEFGDKQEQKDFLINYRIGIAKLLNAYERYKNGNDRRNTIVTKLKSQNRLRIIKIAN